MKKAGKAAAKHKGVPKKEQDPNARSEKHEHGTIWHGLCGHTKLKL
jgi:hypothetical protein